MHYDEAMKHCIFRFVSGSKAYGTDRPDSDTDYRGVFIAPITKAFELFQTSFVGHGPLNEQLRGALEACEDEDVKSAHERIRKALETDQGDLSLSVGTVNKPGEDESIHELRKFLKLAADCNPNIVEFLYVDRLVTHESDEWRAIKSKRDMFLSKKARHTFSGYAIAQLERIKTHRGYLLNPPGKKPDRKDFGLSEGSGIPKESQNALLTIPEKWLAEGAKDEVIREKKYKGVLDNWRAYQKWKTERNPKRREAEMKYGYDLKHATHLIRLSRMAKEIVRDGTVHVYRPDRDELRQILNGEWPYERVLEEAGRMDSELNSMYDKSPLRDKPDRKGISDLYLDICERKYGIPLR